MLTKFLDPKNDVAFRRIFGMEKNKKRVDDFNKKSSPFLPPNSVTNMEAAFAAFKMVIELGG